MSEIEALFKRARESLAAARGILAEEIIKVAEEFLIEEK